MASAKIVVVGKILGFVGGPPFSPDFETVQAGGRLVLPHGWSIPPLARVLPSAGIGFLSPFMTTRTRMKQPIAAATWTMLQDQLYASAITRDAICQPMMDDLRARTGCDGTVAHAGLEPEDLDFLSHKTEVRDEIIRIAMPARSSSKRNSPVRTGARANPPPIASAGDD